MLPSGTNLSSNENLGSDVADALINGFRRTERDVGRTHQLLRETVETSADSREAKERALDELYESQARYLSAVNSPEALRRRADAEKAGRRALDMLAAPRAGGGGRPSESLPMSTQGGAPPTRRR